VVRELRIAARDRCCLRGHLINEDELNDAVESDTLHLHHLIRFSDDGPNTEENLMLVCPSCHARIHERPDLYPLNLLQEAKRHWARMVDLIPRELTFETDDEELQYCRPNLVIPFSVESFNLHFTIQAPSNITVRELGSFIGNWILRPLTFYTRTAPYPSILTKAHVGRVSLAAKAKPDIILSANLHLKDISEIEAHELIALVDLRMVQALMANREESAVTQTITLRWGAVPRDLDLHFLHFSSLEVGHVYYRDMGTLDHFPWAKLNNDIQVGFGPEMLSFGLNAQGKYCLAVHNYSGEVPLAGCGATVDVAIGNITKTFFCPDHGEGLWWIVLEFDVESHQMIEVNKIIETFDPNTLPILGRLPYT